MDLTRKYPSYQGGFIWDFVDQAQRWSSDPAKTGSDHIFIFGGEFNDYDPSDNSFCCNGIIAADRSYHPHAYEVAYQYRSIHTAATPEDAMAGKVNVYNENFFIDLSKYRMEWSVEVDGQKVLDGVAGSLDVAPQQTKTIDLGFTAEDIRQAAGLCCLSCADVYLNVNYVLRKKDGLLPAGHQVAYDQICLNEMPQAKFDGSVITGLPSYSQNGSEHVFSGIMTWDGAMSSRSLPWKAVFDAQKGTLVSYVLGQDEFVSEPLNPCFGRAVTENDLGAKLEKRLVDWLYPDFKVTSFDVKADANCYNVTVAYSPLQIKTVNDKKKPVECTADLSMSFKVYADGTVEGVETLKDGGNLSEAIMIPRFGMEFAMPGEYSVLEFYGKGPFENYCDRNSAALIGHYVQRVEDQYHWGYARPQESGTKTSLRWMKVTDDNGKGLMITSDERFSASALPLSRRQLDMSITGGSRQDRGDQRHSLELKKLACENMRSLGKTYINFDLMQMGLGSINSWGALPRPEHRVKGEQEFRFIIRPTDN
jgi:beta-galactosidase